MNFKRKKNDFKWSVKFGNNLDCYDKTYVKITINCRFDKLHYLYKLPYIILKMYWARIFKRKDIVQDVANIELYIGDMNKHADELPDFSTISFPHVVSKELEDVKKTV